MTAPRRNSKNTIDVDDVFPPEQQAATGAFPALSSYPPAPPDNADYDDVTALNNVLAELGADEAGGGFVTVFRETVDGTGKKPDEYLERFPASDFTLDSLKARWGAGKYKINVYQEGRILTRKVITIARDPQSIPTLQAAAPATDLTPVLSAIQQGNEKMVAAILAMAQNQQKQPNRMEMLQEMQIMREMFAPAQAAQPAAPSDPISLLKLGMEMAANAGTGGESNNAWVKQVLDTLGPVLMPALAAGIKPARMPEHQPAQAPQINALPAPTPRPAQLPTEDENPVNIIVVQYLNMLKRAAEQRAPVEEYADSILASIPASSVGEIENLLRPDDWQSQIARHTQVVNTHPEWFSSLREVLLAYIDEDKAAAQIENTPLTPVINTGSVSAHENADTIDTTKPTGDASGIA